VRLRRKEVQGEPSSLLSHLRKNTEREKWNGLKERKILSYYKKFRYIIGLSISTGIPSPFFDLKRLNKEAPLIGYGSISQW